MKKRSSPSSRSDCEVVDHPLERAAPGADALDRHDLGLDREDRLDPQRGADPRLRAADPAAAAEELERVDGEEDLRAPARRARGRAAAPGGVGAVRGGVGGGDRPSGRGRRRRVERVDDLDPLGRDAALDQLVAGLLGRADGAGDPAADRWIETMSAPALDQRLVDREEVADRRLRRASAARATERR